MPFTLQCSRRTREQWPLPTKACLGRNGLSWRRHSSEVSFHRPFLNIPYLTVFRPIGFSSHRELSLVPHDCGKWGRLFCTLLQGAAHVGGMLAENASVTFELREDSGSGEGSAVLGTAQVQLDSSFWNSSAATGNASHLQLQGGSDQEVQLPWGMPILPAAFCIKWHGLPVHCQSLDGRGSSSPFAGICLEICSGV